MATEVSAASIVSGASATPVVTSMGTSLPSFTATYAIRSDAGGVAVGSGVGPADAGVAVGVTVALAVAVAVARGDGVGLAAGVALVPPQAVRSNAPVTARAAVRCRRWRRPPVARCARVSMTSAIAAPTGCGSGWLPISAARPVPPRLWTDGDRHRLAREDYRGAGCPRAELHAEHALGASGAVGEAEQRRGPVRADGDRGEAAGDRRPDLGPARERDQAG